MITLGINAAFHDCSAALVIDGQVIAAAEEERFTHVKHGKRPLPFTTWQLPFHAIDYCLREAGLMLREVDQFAYSFAPQLLPAINLVAGDDDVDLPQYISLPLEPSAHPLVEDGSSPWDPLFMSYVVNAPRQLAGGAPHHLEARFRDCSLDHINRRWRFIEHHLAHEASAFLACPFEECAVLTLDGRGERTTTSSGVFDGRDYRRLHQVNLPHSLGLLYEQVTRWLGFLHSSDEYKVMALASFGKPKYLEQFRSMVTLDGRGGYTVAKADLVELFGPARLRGGPLEAHHYDVTASLQQVLEETVLSLIRWLKPRSGSRNLAMAGGVALNCVMNARLRDEGPFDRVWVQPAAGDAGTSLGAALWVDYEERRRRGASLAPRWVMNDAYLGPAYSDDEIERFLIWSKLRYRRLDNVAAEAAKQLAADRVIGWFQGRMEFGPRALGARSILASPVSPDMQRRLNEIKDREDFRPVAPVVLEHRARHWFSRRRQPAQMAVNGPRTTIADDGEHWRHGGAYMLFVFDVQPDIAALIPAVQHIDGTARVQTIRREQNPVYHDLLVEFEQLTGVPVLVNTSFNTRGEPVVCTPRDAIESFWTSPLDALVIGSFLIEKAA